jgi:DNA repair exonuclease SbcCD ATPase subunit
MNDINIKKIELNNFRSYIGYHEFVFDYDAIFNIIGANGSGKSTLIADTINFVMFNDTRANKTALQNIYTKKSCWVNITFSLNDSTDVYQILRGINKNRYEIRVNDDLLNDIYDDRISAINEKLNKIVNLDSNVNDLCIFNNKTNSSRYTQLSLNEKREIFLNLFFDWKTFTNITKEIANDLQETQTNLTINSKSINEITTTESNDDILNLEEQLKGITIQDYDVIQYNVTKNRRDELSWQFRQFESLSSLINAGKCPTCHRDYNKNTYEDFLKNNQIDIDSKKKEYNHICQEIKTFETIIKQNEENNIKRRLLTNNINQLKRSQEIRQSNKLVDLEKERQTLQGQFQQFETLKKMFSNTGDFSAFVCCYTIDLLNHTITNIIKEHNLDITFAIDPIDYKIKLPVTEQLSFDDCSSGERKMIDMVIMFAIYQIKSLKNGIRFNFVVLDELIDGAIDKDNYEKCLDLLFHIFRDKQIFFISHRKQISDRENIKQVEVTKCENFGSTFTVRDCS